MIAQVTNNINSRSLIAKVEPGPQEKSVEEIDKSDHDSSVSGSFSNPFRNYYQEQESMKI